MLFTQLFGGFGFIVEFLKTSFWFDALRQM